jgi:hypothetical protein
MAAIKFHNSTQIARMSPVRELRSAILTHDNKRRETRSRREKTSNVIINLRNFLMFLNESKVKTNGGIHKVCSLFFDYEFVVVFDLEVRESRSGSITVCPVQKSPVPVF